MFRIFIQVVCYIFIPVFCIGIETSVANAGVDKIVLWQKGGKNSKEIQSLDSLEKWAWVDWSLLDIDDNDNIFVLNYWGRRILVFNKDGALQKKIVVDGRVPFDIKRTRPCSFVVSGDGNTFYVYSTGNTYVLDHDGQLSNTVDGFLVKLVRHCGEVYTNIYGDNISLEDYKLLGLTPKKKHIDYILKENYSLTNKNILKKVIESQNNQTSMPSYIYKPGPFIGIDGGDNVYFEIFRSKDHPSYIAKYNRDGIFIQSVALPKSYGTPIALTEAEIEDLYDPGSDEPLAFEKLNCSGNTYIIYGAFQLPESAKKRWIDTGEYYIYKVSLTDTLGNSAVSNLLSYFKHKQYEGNLRKYDEKDLEAPSLINDKNSYIHTLRNEIFARHGRIFKSEKLKHIFESTDWYMPDPNYSDDMLNEIEKKNVQFILDYEKKMGWR